jgi:hypothetical protein
VTGVPDLLPDSRASYVSTPRNLVWRDGHLCAVAYCFSCGVACGWVLWDMSHASVLCDPCHVKHGAAMADMWIPDQVVWEESAHQQLEEFGKYLTEAELAEEVKRPNSKLGMLARKIRFP